jgi:hypothetical protein
MTEDIKQQLREEVPDGLPLDVQEEVVDAITGESNLPIDTGLEVVVRPVDQTMWEETHVHGGTSEIVFHLDPEDARIFDSEVLDPVIVSMMLDGELDFDNDYNTENCQ